MIREFIISSSTLGKYKEGVEMAKAVKLMLPRSSMSHVRSRSIYVLECFINHCILPLRETLAPLLRGYEVGLKSGNTEDAAMCRKFFYECLYSSII